MTVAKMTIQVELFIPCESCGRDFGGKLKLAVHHQRTVQPAEFACRCGAISRVTMGAPVIPMIELVGQIKRGWFYRLLSLVFDNHD